MGFAHLLAVLRGLALAMAMFGTFPAMAQPEPPNQPPSFLAILGFNIAQIRTEYGNGYGIVVAKRGQDLLIATAGHVVIDEANEIISGLEVTLLADENGRTSTVAGTVLPPGRIGAEGEDLAFVVVTRPEGQPVLPAGVAAGAPEPGDVLWVVHSRGWLPQPGRVLQVDDPIITFSGSGAQRGDLGSPIAGYGGLVG